MSIKVSVIIPVYNQEELIIKALDSIPVRDDIEVIVIDDCSYDNTLKVVRDYQLRSELNLAVLYNDENKGVGYTVNRGYDVAQGKWIVLLGSDDYFFKDKFNSFIDERLDDSYDLVYFDLIDNRNILWKNDGVGDCPGSVKFMKRSFLGDTRGPNIRSSEDLGLYKKLLEKNPRCLYTRVVLKHYNHPRVNSLSYLEIHGMEV